MRSSRLFMRLDASQPGIAELLAYPPGVEDIEFSAPVSADNATPADFERFANLNLANPWS